MKRNSKIALAVTAAALPMAGRLLMDGRRSQPGWEKLLDWRYAHRGLYDNDAGIPENSLAAFRRAAEAGFGAELDVHLTADGQLAVIHDSDLRRVCGRAGKVEELTYAELSQLRLLGTEECIPLLSDVLPLFAGVAPLIVELKPIRGNEPELAEKVCALLDTFPDLDYCLESFDPFAVLWLRKNRPELIRGQLSQNFLRDQDRPKFLVSFLLSTLFSNAWTRPDFIAWRWQDRKSPFRALCCRGYRIQGVYWTLTSPEQLLSAEREGALGIFEGFRPTSPHRGGAI